MSRNRTICFFCSVSSFTTGMPISTFKLIQHFSSSPEYTVHAIFPEDGELPARVRLLGVTVWLLPFSRFRLVSLRSFLSAVFRYIPALTELTAILRRSQVDIVHFSDFIDAPFYPAASLAGSHSVAHLRMCIESRILRIVYQLWTRIWIDRIVCITCAVMRFAGLRRNASVVYNPGPDPFLFDPQRPIVAAPALKPDRQRVLAISDFREVKGHEHFIDVAGRVKAALPGQTQFIIVGGLVPSHERYYDRMLKRIRDAGLQDCFTITGKVRHEEVPSMLHGASVLVHLPNYQEGFGGVILEAMMMRVPVVSFDCGGTGECFTDSVSGFLVRQFDILAASDKLCELLRNRELRLRMGENARTEVLNRFSFSRHFADIENVYKSL